MTKYSKKAKNEVLHRVYVYGHTISSNAFYTPYDNLCDQLKNLKRKM